MIISQKLLIILTVMGTGILAICYASQDMWPWVFLITTCGIFWLYGQKRRWGWAASFGLIFFLFAMARGVFLDIPRGWLLLNVVIVLCAWDLDNFVHRLKQAEWVEKAHDLEWLHLKRLMIIAGSGLVLGGISLVAKVELKFGWIIFWGIVLIIGLSRIIESLNRESD